MVGIALWNDPEHWRKRADKIRSLSEAMKDETSREAMLKIAEEYEHLAKRAEERLRND